MATIYQQPYSTLARSSAGDYFKDWFSNFNWSIHTFCLQKWMSKIILGFMKKAYPNILNRSLAALSKFNTYHIDSTHLAPAEMQPAHHKEGSFMLRNFNKIFLQLLCAIHTPQIVYRLIQSYKTPLLLLLGTTCTTQYFVFPLTVAAWLLGASNIFALSTPSWGKLIQKEPGHSFKST